MKKAWVEAYGAISQIMLDGADYSQAEIALKPEPSSNTEISYPDVQPLTYSAATSGNSNDSELVKFSHDSGKATIFALVGGGIMGIIATILALLI